ncbi:RHS repeat-associated core domain-containing protein [Gorillibacterium sp. CAU 1737]|uniref:RHS repeat-associated core domain-containing protein n=1 Tax=Gorillibacterium sp. CAU 1737 TaxID=3140362 RepID=UPI003260A804
MNLIALVDLIKAFVNLDWLRAFQGFFHGRATQCRRAQQFGYDEIGNRVSAKDERGYLTRYAYDSMNRLTGTTDASNHTFTRKYDKGGNKVADINAKGDQITYIYDKLNRLSLTLDPYQVTISKNIYDANGNVTKLIDAKGYASANSDEERYGTLFTYNLANNLLTKSDPETLERTQGKGISTRYTYDSLGRVVKQTDALGNSTGYQYDPDGKLTKVTDPSGTEVSYEYDRIGNKISMTDGRDKVTQYEYGSFGLLRKVTDAVNTSDRYGYDLSMNRRMMIDRLGNHTVFTYNARNLILEKRVVETGDRIQFEYDEVGNRVKMTDESGTRSFVYDSLNQLFQIWKNAKIEVEYSYDTIGNVESVSDALGNKTTYSYDKSSRMLDATSGEVAVRYTYDKNGNRTTAVHGGGVRENFSFDKNNRLVNLTNKRPNGNIISSYVYTYDANGRQISKKDDYGTTTYSYDEEGRISRVVTPGKTTVYSYDGSGNRLSMQETYASEQPIEESVLFDGQAASYLLKKSDYVYSDVSQLLQLEERMVDAKGQEILKKTTVYLYDANGNQISQKASYLRPSQSGKRPTTGGSIYGETGEINTVIEKVTQAYDGFNRLKSTVKVKGGNRVTVEYQYDGDGLRRGKTVSNSKDGYQAKATQFVYDRDHVILETDASGKLTHRYIRGIKYLAHTEADGKANEYLYNGHGDVVQTITKEGEVQNRYDYDIFGNPTLSIESHTEAIRYAGEYYDVESGLYYLRARYYNPYIGRFITKDSYWGEDNNPLSLNLYTYSHNDPIRFIDPTGHRAMEESGSYGGGSTKKATPTPQKPATKAAQPTKPSPQQFQTKIITNMTTFSKDPKKGAAQVVVHQQQKPPTPQKAAPKTNTNAQTKSNGKSNTPTNQAHSQSKGSIPPPPQANKLNTVKGTATSLLDTAKKELSNIDKDIKNDKGPGKLVNLVVGIGLGILSFGDSAAEGIRGIVDDPMQAGKGLLTAVRHPVETTRAIKDGVVKSYKTEVTSDEATSRTKAKFFTEVGLNIATAIDGVGAVKTGITSARGVLNGGKAATKATEKAASVTATEDLLTIAKQNGNIKMDPHELLRQNGIPSTLSEAEVRAANAVDLRMEYKGTGKVVEINNPVLDSVRTGSALKLDAQHAFNNIIDNYASSAQKFNLVGGDKVTRELYQIEGSFNGKKGVFEWIVDPDPLKGVTHRRFIGDVGVTGKPNAIPKR